MTTKRQRRPQATIGVHCTNLDFHTAARALMQRLFPFQPQAKMRHGYGAVIVVLNVIGVEPRNWELLRRRCARLVGGDTTRWVPWPPSNRHEGFAQWHV